MIKQYIKGSILDAPQKCIAHGVNCQNKMGSGVAKVLFKKYPKVKEDYHNLFKENEHLLINGTADLLGTIQLVDVCDGKYVINMFTQEFYGYGGNLYVSYSAVEECFKQLSNLDSISEVAIPKIGCGLAGGDWDIVSKIIDDATGSNLDVYVYEI